jgi:hypothetical protein
MWHAWERREKCSTFRWESPKERDHLENQGVSGRMGSEWILGRLAWGCGLDSTGSGQGPWRAVVSAVMSLRDLAPRSKLVSYDIAQTYRIMHRVKQHLSQHNLKISHYHYTQKLLQQN